MRKLASIQIIEWIAPIEGKDRIELAGVQGWQVIVQKNEYAVGDKTVFCEIDSVFPDLPKYEFLRKNKFRIRTIKMGGVLSQGICFPLSVLPKGGDYDLYDDVTEQMGIVQYVGTLDKEPEQKVFKKKNFVIKFLFRFKFFRMFMTRKQQRRGFPEFISKTDEVRLQNIPHILDNKEIKYTVTEKIDGTLGTFFLKKNKRKYEFGVCSRNLRLYDDDNSVYWQVAKKYKLREALEDLIGKSDFVVLQGEIIAPKVQENKYKVAEPDVYMFNLIYPDGKEDSITGALTLLMYDLKWVPILATDFMLLDTVNGMLGLADGSSNIAPVPREGLVLRNHKKNISFKVVSPEFLIKNGE